MIINLGVVILFLINNFFEINLFMQIDEASTPECVYLIFSFSKIN